MIDAVTKHQFAVSKSREETIARFGEDKWPTNPGTPEHIFWLNRYESALAEAWAR